MNYVPRGAARQLGSTTDPEVLFEGPAGVGKSRAWLERVHFLAQKYPRSRQLIVRKTRRSLTESGLVTFERDVIPPRHPILGRRSRSSRESYVYPNGSEVIVGGIDQPSKVLSTEYDLIYVQEATELEEEDWETLLTRLRNGRMPIQQLGADCNPSRPTHWLNQRCIGGRTVRICGSLQDNPIFWTGTEWTPRGIAYRETLDRLTGARRARLRDGRWAAAEGVVFDEFDPRVHVVPAFEPPSDWRRVWVVDFGYTNPFVWQDWAIDPDGRAFLVREIYRTQRLVRDHARHILRLALGSPRPEAIVCDHDAEGRATLEEELGIRTTAAKKSVREGIQRVKDRLRPAGDGRPRLFLMKDALVERDPSLVESKAPTCGEEEVDGYVWNPARPDEPVKEHDHAMDGWRYLAAYLDRGPRRVATSVQG